jgi:hypothetical protein
MKTPSPDAMRNAVGMPAGKKMSVKNLAKRGAAKRRPKAGAARDSDSDYA